MSDHNDTSNLGTNPPRHSSPQPPIHINWRKDGDYWIVSYIGIRFLRLHECCNPQAEDEAMIVEHVKRMDNKYFSSVPT